MQINKKILLGICTLLITLSIFPTSALCQTTIGDSTFPAEEGDTYTWICTYCHSSFSPQSGEGSYINMTIDRIYQGTYEGSPNALIVEATMGYYTKATNSYESLIHDPWVVYNSTLKYISYRHFSELYMIPIPLNTSMICEFIETSHGQTCECSENRINFSNLYINDYQFNSNGMLTTMTFYENEIKIAIYKLKGSRQQISFGFLYILLSFITIAVIALTIKRKIS